jgi:hypothetical protein
MASLAYTIPTATDAWGHDGCWTRDHGAEGFSKFRRWKSKYNEVQLFG